MGYPLAVTIALSFHACFGGLARAEERFFDSNGVKIRFVIAGEGEAVVLLHGLTGRAESWGQNRERTAKTMPELAKSYRVIALDCRGHGQSEKPHDPKKYGREMVEDVVRLLDHLKIKKVHVVGSSMGAWIAGTLLVTHPDRLLSVTLVGGGPWFEPSKEFVASTALLIQGLEQGSIQSPFFRGQDQKALAALLRGVQETRVTEAQLKANKIPALVVYGSKDGDEADRKQLLRMATLLGADAKVIEGADHLGTETSPVFLETVLAFIKKHQKGVE
jgi:pimeloyl-ACP methyl ester carboxylesterase